MVSFHTAKLLSPHSKKVVGSCVLSVWSLPSWLLSGYSGFERSLTTRVFGDSKLAAGVSSVLSVSRVALGSWETAATLNWICD